MNNSYLLTDLNIFKENIREILNEIAERAPRSSLIPVLKDDAYGLGLEVIGSAAAEFDEIKFIACAHVSEGLRLRKAGVTKDIMILGNPVKHMIREALLADLTLTISCLETLEEIIEAAGELHTGKIKVQIEIDSGLHRTGFLPGSELSEFIREFKPFLDLFELCGIYSHFSSADSKEICDEEYCTFLAGIAELNRAGIQSSLMHISSSASFENFPEYSMDAVRIGRRLYMDAPEVTDGRIQELASWRAYITGIYHRKKGDSIGYGKKMLLDSDKTLAVISVGYGDGLNEALVEKHAPVLAGGKRRPMLACFMDQTIIDISETDCRTGDEVTLFGYDEKGNYLSSQELALMIGENEGCGLTGAISSRVERKYIG